MTQKEKLDKKIEQELKNFKIKNGMIYPVMKEYYHYILATNELDEEEIEKMLNCNNLLQDLADLYITDDRVMDLQEKILQEYLHN